MRNIKLIIQYDGTAYHGWQTQKNAPTVQEIIEQALLKLTGSKPNVIGCSRTDAGVHAKRFCCNFKSETTIPENRFTLALNTYLPDDIVCLGAEDVSSDFNARFSAVKKTYTYYVQNSKLPNAFQRNYAWHFPYKVNIDDMNKAAKAFIGEHDFIGFASSGYTVKTTVRTIYDLTVEKSGDLIKITVTGNGFLYNMVRIIAGTLCFAGCGKINPGDMADIINSCDRQRAGITAPPQGLFLTELYYE